MADSATGILARIALKIPGLRSLAGNTSAPGFKPSKPLLGILLLAAIAAVGLPLANITIIFPAYTELVVSTMEDEGKRLAAYAIPASLKNQKLTHESMDTPRFLADIYKLEASFALLKIKTYSPEGFVLYSSDISETNALNTEPHFENIIARGQPYSRLTFQERQLPGGTIERIDVVETAIPIMDGQTFLGAFEFFFDVTRIKRPLDRFNTYATYGSAITSACLLIVVISLLYKESSRAEAHRKAHDLKEAVDQITRHDIKTPLISALNGVDYLERYTETSADQEDMLADMRQAVNTGLDLINRSLDIYKMETGRYEYTPQSLDLREMAQRVVTDLSGLAAQKGVVVRVDTERGNDAVPVAAEESLLYSLLANLIKNGIEASPDGKAMAVDIETGTDVSFTIRNQGTVPESIRATFFEKFTTSGKADGTGLGTYSARLMTRTMGGSITMESSEEDGTAITVNLPADTA